jgi:L,D-transpeptidase YcbB
MRRPSPIPCLVAILAVFLAAQPVRAYAAGTAQQSCAGPYAPAGPESAGMRLCRLTEAGELPELRWPDFTEYREQIRQFYGAAFALAWTRNGAPTPQALALIQSLQRSEEKGLEAEDYDAAQWEARLERLSSSTPPALEDLARFDLALTVSALRYVSHLRHGRLAPPEFQAGLKTSPFDAAGFLKRYVVEAADVPSALAQAEPAWPGYRRALKAYQDYLALARGGESEPLPRGDQDVYPDSSYAGVMQIAARLRRTGDLPADAKIARPEIYEEPLVAAVKKFEGRNGIEPDGILGPDTYKELDTPLAQRALQLKLSLERWRWLPQDLGPRFITVNIPEFRLRAYEDRRATLTMRAIVGEALGHRTPMFADRMDTIVFRPYWNVPLSIQKNEVLPDIRKEPRYLLKHRMEVVNGAGRIVTADTVTPAVLRQLDAGELAVRQQPGPANALGLIKFVFPSQEAIYLHGTPEQNLFSAYRRDFSHGCIRLEDPSGLAAWVLRGHPMWTPARIADAMTGQNALSVRIARPIPVLILYNTAMVEENGDVHFFDDIYGQDAALDKALRHSPAISGPGPSTGFPRPGQ